MLSRTADHLFWMARYTERAENTARMLDVRVQYSLMPQSAQAEQQGWRTMLGVSELQSQFDAKYAALTQKEVLDFMVRDPDNPSSIASCLRAARENARAVRGTLTTEVWEIVNSTWLALQQHLKSRTFEHNPGQFLEWVKYRSHMSRGVTLGTMFQDEAFNFIRLGTFLERADNTARILDVKFRFFDSDTFEDGAQGEFYYLGALLRSVSAFETYRKAYRDAITPKRVAELLILESKMPRSLVACLCGVVSNLQEVRNDQSHETERLAEELYARLQSAQIEEILEEGLHQFLTRFLASIAELGNGIGRDFLLPVAPELPEESTGTAPTDTAPAASQTQTQTQSQTQTQTQVQAG